MQPLYAVELDVQSAENTMPGPFEVLRELLAAWLDGPQGHVSADDLRHHGSPRLLKGGRTAEWEVEQTTEAAAVRVTVRQPLSGGPGRFVTRVTIAEAGETATLRVVMGREVPGGWIAPVQDPLLRRPGILRNAALDQRITLRVLGQVVTGRYEPIRDPAEVNILLGSLATPTRLPILLIHPRDQAAWSLAKSASTELAGLAQVVTLNYSASRELAQRRPELAVPDGGARLVWPDTEPGGPDHPYYKRADLVEADLCARWMARLGQLAVMARGHDGGWDQARRSARRAASIASAERLERARSSGDTSGELATLNERVASLEGDVDFWETEAQELTTKLEAAEKSAAQSEQFRQLADYWRRQYESGRKATEAPEGDPWAAVPELGADADVTYRALEVAADKHIVFTERAERAWHRCGYPYPGEMTQILVTLAKAAVDLYSGEEEKLPRLDDWFKSRHGLNVALSDHKLKQDRDLRLFSFDGKDDWDRTPHVKIRDATSPNEVGRVYFAFDSVGKRLIVDHVGVKVY